MKYRSETGCLATFGGLVAIVVFVILVVAMMNIPGIETFGLLP